MRPVSLLDPPLENPPLDTLAVPELPLDDDDDDPESPPTLGAPPCFEAVVGSDSRGLTRVYPSPSTTRPAPLGRSGRPTPPPPPVSMTAYPPL